MNDRIQYKKKEKAMPRENMASKKREEPITSNSSPSLSARQWVTSEDLLREILSSLKKVTGPDKHGNYWALCPFHDDHKPSLSIHPAKGFRCFGCDEKGSLKELAKKMGISSETPSSERPPITYNYRNEKGELVYQVCRVEPKGFYQRRPDPDHAGQYINNMKGIERIPYRLPELLASPKDEIVFIAEGEKDCDNLTGEGLVATTNPGGAGKWLSSFNKYFEGRRVCILPDNDKPGREHAAKVKEELKDVAAEVCILELQGLPEKGEDVTDWIKQRHEEGVEVKNELLQLAKDAFDTRQQEELEVLALSSIQREEIRWLWEPYIPVGKLTILEGDPGIGKTWVALAICSSLTQKGHPILYTTVEDGPGDTIRPRAEDMGADLERFFIPTGIRVGQELQPFTLENLALLEQALTKYRPALIVLDPIQGFLGGKVDIHRANEVRAKLAPLARLAETHGVSFLLVRHLTKAVAERAIYRGMGSIDFTAAARSVLMVGKTQQGERALVQIKNNIEEFGPSLGFEIANGRFHWKGEVEITAQDLLQPEAELEGKGKLDETVAWLRETLSSGPVEKKELVKQARAQGLIGESDILLRRAKDKLGVKAKPQKYSQGEQLITGLWWMLPEHHPVAHLAHPLNSHNEHLEQLAENPHQHYMSSTCSNEDMMSNWKEPSNDKGFGASVPVAQIGSLESKQLDEQVEDNPLGYTIDPDESDTDDEPF